MVEGWQGLILGLPRKTEPGCEFNQTMLASRDRCSNAALQQVAEGMPI